MSDGLANFNRNSVVQSLTADTPEDLTALIRKIRVPFDIINFVAASGKHTVYFRSQWKIKVTGRSSIEQESRLR